MKGMAGVTGIRDIKTIHSVGCRSIPKVQRSSYLDLHLLKREKDRWGQEFLALDKRRKTVKKHLDGINKQIKMLQEEMRKEKDIEMDTSVSSHKKMTINY
ncbi:MAG: hypothetical protein AAB296_03950 [Candidatus Desantisbacteria bacterium]